MITPLTAELGFDILLKFKRNKEKKNMARKHIMYVIDTDHPYDSEFLKSAWAGEGYSRKRDAQSHLKFWKENGMFQNEKLTISTEEAPW